MRRVPSSAKPGGRFEDNVVVLVVWRKLSRTFRRCFTGLRKFLEEVFVLRSAGGDRRLAHRL